MFSVKDVLVRVTHGKDEAAAILASYGDADRQAEQAKRWQAEGWQIDSKTGEWFFNHPVPQVVWKDDPTLDFPDTLSPEETESLNTALDDLYDAIAERVDAYKLAALISAGYQYKTRPNLKKASTKGQAAARFSDLQSRFAKSQPTPEQTQAMFAAMAGGTESLKVFLETWAKGK
jgi:hypothetical protein